MKLTKSYIDEIRYSGERKGTQIHWDDRVPGFGVRVLPSGTKTFVFKYRHAGRARFLTLGKFGPLTLNQALTMAKDRYLELRHGLDPKAEAEKARLQNATVTELADYFFENHTKIKNRDHDKVRLRINKWIKPKLGKMVVREVKRPDIARLHNEIGRDHPTNANRILSLLSKMFNEAVNWGYLEENAPNPTKGIKRFPEVSRERFVTRDEFPKLAKAIQSRDIFTRTLIWLYLLTGLRKTELLSLPWDAVDLEEGRILVKVTKSGKPHHLPLSAAAVKMLADLPRMNNSPYVFPGAKLGTHRKDFRAQWNAIKEEAEVTDLRIHDLRRTVGSYMAQEGHSLALIGKVLNHSNPKTTQIYARFSEEPVRKALEDHSKIIEGVFTEAD